jgi:Fe-S-cluster containining protein
MTREQFLNSLHIEGLNALIAEYDAYDHRVASVGASKNYGCLPGCGACCNRPGYHLEVSVFEMIPLAVELFRLGKADDLYEKLDQIDTSESVCVLYHPTSSDGNQGHCTMHPQRPLICRMFAGSSRWGKHGKKELILCRPLKDAYQSQPEVLDDLLDVFPNVKDYCSQLRDLSPDLSQKLMPINEAIKGALDLILNKWHYASCEDEPNQ